MCCDVGVNLARAHHIGDAARGVTDRVASVDVDVAGCGGIEGFDGASCLLSEDSSDCCCSLLVVVVIASDCCCSLVVVMVVARTRGDDDEENGGRQKHESMHETYSYSYFKRP